MEKPKIPTRAEWIAQRATKPQPREEVAAFWVKYKQKREEAKFRERPTQNVQVVCPNAKV